MPKDLKNVNYLAWHSHSLEQLIDDPTRVTKSIATLIGMIFTNSQHRIVDSGVIHLGLSDHFMIFCVFKARIGFCPCFTPSTTVASVRICVASTYPYYILTLSFQATSHNPTIFHHLDIHNVGI